MQAQQYIRKHTVSKLGGKTDLLTIQFACKSNLRYVYNPFEHCIFHIKLVRNFLCVNHAENELQCMQGSLEAYWYSVGVFGVYRSK